MSKSPSKSLTSVWKAKRTKHQGILDPSQEVDICIVGAGIAGLSVGYLLAKEGKRVLILEANYPGCGETGNSSAHLASALDEGFVELENLFGLEGAYLAAESHRIAIDTIEKICTEESIDCGFERVNGYLFTERGESTKHILAELAAARRAGFRDATEVQSVPKLKTGVCIQFPQQAQFNPIKYLNGLQQGFKNLGGHIVYRCEVKKIDEDEEPCVTVHSGEKIHCQTVVVTTNTPINDIFTLHTKQHAFRTYMMAFQIPTLALAPELYWDTCVPYHYVRSVTVDNGKTLLLAGGEDHRTGEEKDRNVCYERLESWTRKHFPFVGEVERKWSGQIMEPVDGLAFIGQNPGSPKNIFVATGDSGHGLTHGTIAGLLLTDLILGRPNPWRDLYNPSRVNFHLKSLAKYAQNNFNTMSQYLDYITPGDIQKIEEIPTGEGAVLGFGFNKVAVYHSHDDKFVCLSAVCPHLGGAVHWNTTEKSWDCPCHGSRFSINGSTLNGPAVSDLRHYASINSEKSSIHHK